jgi:release factor glutamine methyltransferase
MSVSLSSDSLSAVIGALRTAGCVFAEDEAALLASEARTPADLSAMVDRRVAGLPLEQVLGWAEFCGLRIAVEPGVFVPRRRTEFLAHEAASLAREAASRAREAVSRARESAGLAAGPVVVDLCCGSGAVGAAVAAAAGRIELHAADIDQAAVRCARRNLASAGGHVYQGDLFEPLPATLRGRVDVLVANAPYVPTREVALLPAEAREHEPRVALDGGPDGLHILRRVAAAAPRWLAPGGHLLVETTEHQAPPIAAVMIRGGLSARVAVCDELDTAVVTATKPAETPETARTAEPAESAGT